MKTTMIKTNNAIQKLLNNERGASTVEYVVLVVIMVVCCVAMWNMFGDTVMSELRQSNDKYNTQLATENDKGL